MKKINLFELLLFIVMSELIGSVGSMFTIPSLKGWYQNLNKSPFNPPNFIFGPVWIILFLMMGISSYLIFKERKKDKKVKTAMLFFVIQFLLNVFWSLLFFGLKVPLFAFIEILALWFFILLTILTFIKVNKTAGFLLIPYIIWVSFASYLNLMVYLLNK